MCTSPGLTTRGLVDSGERSDEAGDRDARSSVRGRRGHCGLQAKCNCSPGFNLRIVAPADARPAGPSWWLRCSVHDRDGAAQPLHVLLKIREHGAHVAPGDPGSQLRCGITFIASRVSYSDGEWHKARLVGFLPAASLRRCAFKDDAIASRVKYQASSRRRLQQRTAALSHSHDAARRHRPAFSGSLRRRMSSYPCDHAFTAVHRGLIRAWPCARCEDLIGPFTRAEPTAVPGLLPQTASR